MVHGMDMYEFELVKITSLRGARRGFEWPASYSTDTHVYSTILSERGGRVGSRELRRTWPTLEGGRSAPRMDELTDRPRPPGNAC